MFYRLHFFVEDQTTDTEARKVECLSSLLGELQAMARADGTRFVLIVLSNPLKDRASLENVVRELGIPTLNPGGLFWRDIGQVIPNEGHLTCRGNQSVAAVIADSLVDSGLAPQTK